MTTRKIAFAAVIAAVYAALTMVLSWISYGPIQFRIAEALCILPFFFPFATPGLFVGCVIANLLSPYGPLDIIGGSLATLIAVTCTMLLGYIYRKSGKDECIAIKAAACFPPVIFNAVIIGAIIAYMGTDSATAFWPLFASFGLQVGLGELVVMYLLGLPLMILLPKSRVYKSLLEIYGSV